MKADAAVKIAVHTLPSGGTHLETAMSPDELGMADERAEFGQPVLVRVKLTRMQEDVLAQGRARTRVRMTCSRCLEAIEVPIDAELEALYVPQTGPYGERMGRRDFQCNDERVSFYEEGTVDLTEEIRECLLVELPLKPLCRPDCAGLCPQCGKNLNQGFCDCEADEDDAGPFAALRDLISPEE